MLKKSCQWIKVFGCLSQIITVNFPKV